MIYSLTNENVELCCFLSTNLCSGHMKQIVATLGIHRIIYTQPYRPQGHGKIEALNKYIRNAFIAELKASSIRPLTN